MDPRQVAYEVMNTIDHDTVPEDTLDNDEESGVIECVPKTYRNLLPLHGIEEDSSSLESDVPSGRTYVSLANEDAVPVEAARARFLDIILNYFIAEHVIEVAESTSSCIELEDGKQSKKKQRVVQYEGDDRFVLPLMYMANMYETLVNDANARLAALTGGHEKSIGLALEANGGLYRKLSKMFPRTGPCTFKRRELATSVETRKRFPELVVHEEKRVRFVVVNGLEIVEKPAAVPIHEAEWFKRLTGRNEVAVSPQDYKFYSPRHKYRRTTLLPTSNFTNIPALSDLDNSSIFTASQEFRATNEVKLQSPSNHGVHDSNQSIYSKRDIHLSHNQQCSSFSEISPLSSCLQPLGVRPHRAMPSLAKFCDECGAPFVRETSKFCTECGAGRLGT